MNKNIIFLILLIFLNQCGYSPIYKGSTKSDINIRIINFNSFAPRNNTQLLGINKKISNEINWVPYYTSSKLIYKLCEDFEDYKLNIKLQN